MADSASQPASVPIFQLRLVRIAVGAALFVTCLVLAFSAVFLPLVEYRTASGTYSLSAFYQSANLNLVPAITGCIGAIIAVIYASVRSGLRWSFFVVGGVGAAFSGLLLIDALQTKRVGKVIDPLLFDKIKFAKVHIELGSGIYACIIASLLVVGLAFVAARAQPAPEELEKTRRAKRTRRIA